MLIFIYIFHQFPLLLAPKLQDFSTMRDSAGMFPDHCNVNISLIKLARGFNSSGCHNVVQLVLQDDTEYMNENNNLDFYENKDKDGSENTLGNMKDNVR